MLGRFVGKSGDQFTNFINFSHYLRQEGAMLAAWNLNATLVRCVIIWTGLIKEDSQYLQADRLL